MASPLRSRLLRPTVSKCLQHLSRRHQSTRPSFLRRNRANIIWSTISFAFGLGTVQFGLHMLAPPALPAPGSHEDKVLVADLNKRIDEEFKVKVLRGKCLGVTKTLKGEEAGWVEIIPMQAEQGEKRQDRLLDLLQGAKGLGVERVFYNRSDHQLVAIVYFGPDLSGWPGVTHGGLLATALDDKISLANYLSTTSDLSTLAAAAPQRLPGTGDHAKLPLPSTPIPKEPAQLSVDYKKPTHANDFYVIRVSPAYPGGEDVRIPIQGHEYTATLERLDATICVRATAKFAPRSQAERVKDKVGEKFGGGKGWSYADFKEWMWPSRQKESQIG
ncbi:hypothetical protein CB0940_01533 [Lecanosticta acicola]|uniref:Uncharacterized protein n=1 Tax=Lecanosticta acicola TaxID=111012 RepID=A0AAI9E8R1_9PEZI|nr:hypothetical protein CB0940_01533 [Lecanosticta acicola]